MRPTTSEVHYPGILQNISIAYRNASYIGDLVSPNIPVEFNKDYYYIFDRADELRDTAGYRAPGTSSNRDGFGLSTDNYSCREIAQSTQLADETRKNADQILRMEQAKTRFVTNKILLQHEIMTEAKFMTTANWANSTTPTNKWSDYTNGDPITDIETAISTVRSATGYRPNSAIIAWDVWAKLRHNPQLLSRLSNDTTRILSFDDFKKMFNIETIYIGDASKNTALQGQTASYSDIWTKDVWIGYINQNPGLEEPSAVYTFSWNYSNSPMSEPQGFRGVRKWRDENIHSDIIEAYQCIDQKIVGSSLGYVIEAAIA
jgi:hypothetical protein